MSEECLWSCLVVVLFRYPAILITPISNHSSGVGLGSTMLRSMRDESNDRVSAAAAARLIGVKTQTLAKWRCYGKGPAGWVRVSPTLVTYPLREVERFLVERQGARRR